MMTDPTALVVLASEQLWPNIHSLVHWQKSLRHLFIYHTTDQERSAQPAERLKRLCKEQYPHIDPHLPSEPGLGILPTDVHAQIACWRQAYPYERWLINATGGLKLMSWGLLPSVEEPGTEIVYRELNGSWYRLCGAANGRGVTAQEVPKEALPATETDALRIEPLLRAMWGAPGTEIVFGRAPVQLPILDLTRAFVDERGDWRRAFDRCGPPAHEKGENLFERFIAGVILKLGITNLARNVERRACHSGQRLQEIDLVINYRGRLLIVDCKLASEKAGYRNRDVEPITTQIRQAAETRRKLGGLGAQLLLLRPTTSFQDAERAMAEASRLTVLDQGDCRHLFSGLHHFLGVPGDLPQTLRQAEDELDHAAERPWTNPMRPMRADVEDVAAASGQRAVVDLDAYMREHGQSWVAFRLGDTVEFQSARPEGVTDQAWRRLIQERFGPLHRDFTISRNGNTGWFRLDVTTASYRSLVADLTPCLGGPLFRRLS